MRIRSKESKGVKGVNPLRRRKKAEWRKEEDEPTSDCVNSSTQLFFLNGHDFLVLRFKQFVNLFDKSVVQLL